VPGSARLAELLRLRAAEDLCARIGRDVIATPDVLAFGAWVAREWERSEPLEVLLDDAGEALLWERVIAEDLGVAPEQERLLGLGQLAVSAAHAWDVLQRWGEPDWSRWPATAETEGFGRWSARVRTILDERGWMTRSQLVDAVARAYRAGLHPNATVVFVGLGGPESLDPAMTRLLEALAQHGPVDGTVAVELWNGCEGTSGKLDVREYPTRADEVRAVAAGIRADLEGADSPQSVRLAVTAPSLAAYRPLLAAIFAAELDAAALLAAEDGSDFFVAEAQAEKLSDIGMVAHALDLLELARRNPPFELISRVLLAQFPRMAAEEHDARAHIEASLREDNARTVPVHGPSGLAARARAAGARAYADRLDAHVQVLSSAPTRQSTARWAEMFARRLEMLGWPGGDLDAREREAFEGWREALADLASLELVAGEIDEAEARARLREVLERRTLRTTARCAQIAVVDIADAGVMAFDAVYVVGMTSDAIPPRARLHPLLPSGWQRSVGIEEADPTKVRVRAERMWGALQASAPALHASFARHGEGDEVQRASVLIGERLTHCGPVSPWYSRAVVDPSVLEPRPSEDVSAARVRRGPSTLLRDQSQCPYQALAAHRLRAGPMKDLQLAPTASQRGTLVHEALHAAWKELRTSDALRALRGEACTALAGRAAEQALAGRTGRTIPKHLRAVLRGWLVDLVAAWLAFETARVGEWTVESCEKEVSLRLSTPAGRLELPRLRIDRVDRTPSGRAIVLDYKTGATKSTAKAWLETRPREPQLLLYTLALKDRGEDVEAVVFANLRARDDMSLEGPPGYALIERGRGATRARVEGPWSGWDTELPRLRRNIEALAEQYLAGSAVVDPIRESPSPCRLCARNALCRVFERDGMDDEESAEDEGAGEEVPA